MLRISGHTQVVGVIGDPVRHSRSPLLHNAAFEALDLDWRYVAFPVLAGQGAQAVAAMRVLGIGGLSVTMPHKDSVAAAVDRRTPAVEALGACNCVVRDGGVLVGHNTDGDGFLASLLADAGLEVTGLRAVVLGAGGAARAIIDALGRAGVDSVVVVNRTRSNAERAAALTPRGSVGSSADIASADLVVNATSVGMAGGTSADAVGFDSSLLGSHQIVADIVYQPLRTPLLVAAEQAGARSIGGLGMLVHQAAIQFELWTGHAAPIPAMLAALQPAQDSSRMTHGGDPPTD